MVQDFRIPRHFAGRYQKPEFEVPVRVPLGVEQQASVRETSNVDQTPFMGAVAQPGEETGKGSSGGPSSVGWDFRWSSIESLPPNTMSRHLHLGVYRPYVYLGLPNNQIAKIALKYAFRFGHSNESTTPRRLRNRLDYYQYALVYDELTQAGRVLPYFKAATCQGAVCS